MTAFFFQDCGPGPDPDDFDCEAAGGDGFYAYEKNCRKYVQCSGGLPDIHTCNPGMFILKLILKITTYIKISTKTIVHTKLFMSFTNLGPACMLDGTHV